MEWLIKELKNRVGLETFGEELRHVCFDSCGVEIRNNMARHKNMHTGIQVKLAQVMGQTWGNIMLNYMYKTRIIE